MRAFAAEFLFDKIAAMQELAYQRLPGGDIAVGFQPHAAVHFPFSIRNPFFNLFVNLGAIPFDILVKLRLALQKQEVLILFHEPESGGKGTHCLFPGML